MAPLRLLIEWGGPGTRITVNGPVSDKGVCYAMLELAKDAIREHVEKNQSLVAVAHALPGDGQGKPN
jgi:hypothetical protein